MQSSKKIDVLLPTLPWAQKRPQDPKGQHQLATTESTGSGNGLRETLPKPEAAGIKIGYRGTVED
jgi:hypothetical protein